MTSELRYIRERIIFLEGIVIGCVKGDKQLNKAVVAIDDLRAHINVLKDVATEFTESCEVCNHLSCTCPESTEPEPQVIADAVSHTSKTKYQTLQEFLEAKDISK